MVLVVQTIGSGGTHANIGAWITATLNPLGDNSTYVGELIDEKYEVDAGTLAVTSASVTPSLYRWLRPASG